jgi:hypothetical protein
MDTTLINEKEAAVEEAAIVAIKEALALKSLTPKDKIFLIKHAIDFYENRLKDVLREGVTT